MRGFARPSVHWSVMVIELKIARTLNFEVPVVTVYVCECVWGGRGCGWGFHALAHPSATLLQPRVTCSHHSPHKILYSVQIIVSLNLFSIRHLSNRHACTISKEHLGGFSSGPVGYQNRVMGYFIWLVTFFIHQ